MDQDPLQDIHQPGVGIDAVQAARQHQALQDPDSFRARLGPAEHPVAASQRDRPNASFEMVRVDRHGGMLETDLETASVVAGIADGLEQGILRRARHVVSHGIAPSPEGLDDRPGMLPAPEQLLAAAELLAANLLLLGVETADEVKGLVATHRVEVPDLHKLAPGVTPTARVNHRLPAGLRIGLVALVAVAEKGAREVTEERLDMAVLAGRGIVEDDLAHGPRRSARSKPGASSQDRSGRP